MHFANIARNAVYLSHITLTQNDSGALKENTPDMVVTLAGDSTMLKRAASKIQNILYPRKASQAEAAEEEPDKIKIHSGKLEVNIHDLNGRTPEEMLGIIHKAAGCDIGATVKATVDVSRTVDPSYDEDKINYIPGVEIAISHKDRQTRDIVDNYLRHNLHTEYDEKFHYSSVGTLVIPSEYLHHGGLKEPMEKPEGSIFLTFYDKTTNIEKEAKLDASTAAEHISGQLNIREITEHDRIKKIPKEETYRWN